MRSSNLLAESNLVTESLVCDVFFPVHIIARCQPIWWLFRRNDSLTESQLFYEIGDSIAYQMNPSGLSVFDVYFAIHPSQRGLS